jgi:hypothetical protein
MAIVWEKATLFITEQRMINENGEGREATGTR